MWLARDISSAIEADSTLIQILLGPHQCGKSSLLSFLGGDRYHEVSLDDLAKRELAQRDPALFLEQYPFPLLEGGDLFHREIQNYKKHERKYDK